MLSWIDLWKNLSRQLFDELREKRGKRRKTRDYEGNGYWILKALSITQFLFVRSSFTNATVCFWRKKGGKGIRRRVRWGDRKDHKRSGRNLERYMHLNNWNSTSTHRIVSADLNRRTFYFIPLRDMRDKKRPLLFRIFHSRVSHCASRRYYFYFCAHFFVLFIYTKP